MTIAKAVQLTHTNIPILWRLCYYGRHEHLSSRHDSVLPHISQLYVSLRNAAGIEGQGKEDREGTKEGERAEGSSPYYQFLDPPLLGRIASMQCKMHAAY